MSASKSHRHDGNDLICEQMGFQVSTEWWQSRRRGNSGRSTALSCRQSRSATQSNFYRAIFAFDLLE